MRFLRRGPLFVPDRSILTMPRMQYEAIVTVERFRGDHRAGVLTGRWQFRNLIVNTGLDLIKPTDGTSVLTALSHMGVGTGSAAPAATDTGLGAEISPTSSNRTNSNGTIVDVNGFGASNVYSFLKRTRLFLEAQGNGNLTELGWFTSATGGTMFSRMLFKDDVGTPTTIVKTSSDQLRVTYEIRLYNPADVTGVVTLDGNDYDYTVRPLGIGNTWAILSSAAGPLGSAIQPSGERAYDGALVSSTTLQPSGSFSNADSTVWAAYSGGTFFRDVTVKWEPGSANFAGGIGTVTMVPGSGPSPLFQIGFTPKIPKVNTQRLTLVSRFSWGRYP